MAVVRAINGHRPYFWGRKVTLVKDGAALT